MERKQIIQAFCKLGAIMVSVADDKPWSGYSSGVTQEEYEQLKTVVQREKNYNPWFTLENVHRSLKNLGKQLSEENLTAWLENYPFASQGKRVGVIMAGNIPLVGFHDFLCVLLSGNSIVAKLSSEDKHLLPVLATILIELLPELEERITFPEGKIGKIDAVIATGSDNSLKYFEQYFGHYPHIFRKNRTSVAVLNGTETNEELQLLGNDILDYFGLGCRNVSHLLVPENYSFDNFFEAILSKGEIIHHNKYGNNYDYNRTIHLMNQYQFLDNNFLMLRESAQLHSPLAMVHYHNYTDETEISNYLEEYQDVIQVVVGKNFTPFGEAQCPQLSDYADGVDTMNWLGSL